MAKAYKKGSKIHMNWWDPVLGKSLNRSTGLDYSKENMIKANEIAKKLQEKIDAEQQSFNALGTLITTIAVAKEHFLQNNCNKDQKTIAEYHWFFKYLLQLYKESESTRGINKLKTEQWLMKVNEMNLQPNTKYTLGKELRKFLKFLFEYDYTAPFTLNSGLIPRAETKEIIIFEDEDLQVMLAGLKGKQSNFAAIFYALIFTGLRPSDLLNVKVEDVNFATGVLRYYSPKTRKHLGVPLHEELIPLLQARAAEVGTGKLFNYVNVHNINRAFHKYISDLGLIGKGYNLRTFRKSFVSLAHRYGIDIITVAKLVGHSNMQTTARYYHKMDLLMQGQKLNLLKISKTDAKNTPEVTSEKPPET